MALVPRRATKVVFGLQVGGKGVAAAETLVFPIHEDTDGPSLRHNLSFFTYADGSQYERHSYTEGQWVEGGINIPLIPGMAAGDLGTWWWGRAGDWSQGYWATIQRDVGNFYRETFIDCKCTGGSLALSYGSPVVLRTNLTGVAAPVVGAELGGDRYSVAPYRFREATIKLGIHGAAVATDNYTNNHSIEWSNLTESPGDMGVLNGSNYPIDLPEAGGTQWTGSFDRLMFDEHMYQDFVAGTEAKLTVILARAASYTLTLTFPRIVWTEHTINTGPTSIVKETGVNWRALGSADGATAAFTLAESL